MAHQKSSVIGLSWNPNLPSFTSSPPQITNTNLQSELIDGLYLPPTDPKKLNKLTRKQLKDTAGKNWFDMPAPIITPQLKKDLQLLKLRGAMDPKRFYKKGDSKSKELPKYFQVGTVIQHSTEFYAGRLTKKERKTTIADELLSDDKLWSYRKRKVREIEEKNRHVGMHKWKKKKKKNKN